VLTRARRGAEGGDGGGGDGGGRFSWVEEERRMEIVEEVR